MSISEFFYMNGFGFYIWSSFGMTALLMLGELILIKQQNRRLMQRLRRIIRLQSTESTQS